MITKLAALLVLLSGVSIQAAELAKVDDMVITSEEFTTALKALGPQGEMVVSNPELRKRFLDHMINSKLVARKAKTEQFEKDAKFQARLADVTVQLLAGEYMDRLAEKKSSDKEVKAWFDEHKKEFSKKEVHALHILCDDEATAKKALEEATKPAADFEAIAKKYSKDKTVDLGFFPRGRMVPEFDKVAFETPKGSIHPALVKTTFGWHVIKVTDVKGTDDIDFESIKADVTKKYRQSIQENLVHDLRGKSKIAINEQSLKSVKLP